MYKSLLSAAIVCMFCSFGKSLSALEVTDDSYQEPLYMACQDS